MAAIKIPRVSVLMAAYNAANYIAESVESILTQNFNDFEFIIIDDGSTDGTSNVLAHYDDPRLVLVRNKRNIGLTRSLNKGLTLARGKYIARQDADDLSLPNRLERQVEYLDQNPAIGLLGTSWITINEAGDTLNATTVPTDSEQIKEKLLVSLVIEHPTVMFRKECVELIGNYREIAGSAEDLDLWLRIAERFGISNLSEQLCRKRIHTDSVIGSGLRRHLESLYCVRKMALYRWQESGKALSSSYVIAQCYLLLACHDFAVGRIDQGKQHLHRALIINPSLACSQRQNVADIANYTLQVCSMSGESVSKWPLVGRNYIDTMLSHLPEGWCIPIGNVIAQFLVTLSFDDYARGRFLEAIRHGLSGMLIDKDWCLNIGLWRIMGYSLLRRRVVL